MGQELEGETDKRAILLLFIIRIARSFAAGFVNLIFPYFVLGELHQGPLVLGLIYAASTIATALLGLGVGFTSDLSRLRTYLFALALLPISTAIVVLSHNLILVSVAAMLGGYSATGSLAGGGVGGAAQPIQSAITSDVTSRTDRTFYYGIFGFVAGITSAFGVLVAGFLTINEGFVIATAFGIVSVFPAFFIKTKPHPPIQKLKLKSGKTIGMFSLTGMLNGLSNGLVTPFLIPFFITFYGLTKDQMGVYATISGLIASFALLLGPRMERNLGFLKGVVTSRGSTAFLAIAFPLVHFLPFSLVLYFLFPALRVMAFPVIQTAMIDMVDESERGRAFGVNQATRLALSSAGTGFAGYEFDISAIEIPFFSYALIMGLNVYLYIRFFSSYKDPMKRNNEESDHSK